MMRMLPEETGCDAVMVGQSLAQGNPWSSEMQVAALKMGEPKPQFSIFA